MLELATSYQLCSISRVKFSVINRCFGSLPVYKRPDFLQIRFPKPIEELLGIGDVEDVHLGQSNHPGLLPVVETQRTIGQSQIL